MERKRDHYTVNIFTEAGHVVSSFRFKHILSQIKSPIFSHVPAFNSLTNQTKLSSTSGENFTWETLWLQKSQSVTA